MRFIKHCFFITIFVIAASSALFASGFGIYEHGVTANGLAGAFGGIANDASALYYNPAGISFLSPGKHLTLGSTFIIPKFSWKGTSGSGGGFYPGGDVEMNDKLFFPSNLHFVHTGDGKLACGIGFFNPYGLGTDWPEGWEGRYNIINVSIETFFLQPTISYKVMDNLSVAVALDLAYATAEMKKRSVGALGADPLADINGSGSGLGFNAAFSFKPNDKFTAGVSYRSEVTLDLEGDAVITEAGALEQYLPGGDVKLSITTPSSIGLGLGYKLSDKITLDLDYTWVGWSAFDTLTIDFVTETFSPTSGDPIQADQVIPEAWSDVSNIRIGALIQASENLAIQLGFLTDSNPAQDEYLSPMLPDSDRLGVSFGVSKKMNDNLTLNASYIHLFFKEREIKTSDLDPPFNGIYNGSAELIGLGINYDF